VRRRLFPSAKIWASGLASITNHRPSSLDCKAATTHICNKVVLVIVRKKLVDMSNNRKGVGLSAFSRNALTSDHYASHGAALRSAHADSLANQLSVFQAALHSFSLTHGAEIRSNPTFRAEFARMCNAIGVDPLASSNHKTSKGGKNEGGSFWSQMLGGSVNDFYFELAVRVVEVCRETRSENGGMIEVPQVRKRVEKGRGIGGGLEVSEYVFMQSIGVPY
jgi:ESCRT-II complex subunit VPS22